MVGIGLAAFEADLLAGAISVFGCASGVCSVASGARRFCTDDVLALAGVGLAVEFLVALIEGVISMAHGSAGLLGWNGNKLALSEFYKTKQIKRNQNVSQYRIRHHSRFIF